MITIRKAGNKLTPHGIEKTARKTGLPLSSGIKAGGVPSYPYKNHDQTVIGTCYEFERDNGTCTKCYWANGMLDALDGPCS